MFLTQLKFHDINTRSAPRLDLFQLKMGAHKLYKFRNNISSLSSLVWLNQSKMEQSHLPPASVVAGR